MRRRLILSTALIALAAVIVLGVPLGVVDAARIRSESTSRLEREADDASALIDDRVEAHRPIPAALLDRARRAGHRIVATLPGGRTVVTGPPLRGPIQTAHAGARHGGPVIAQAPAAETDGRIHRAWLLLGALGLGGVLTATALASLQARRLARPLEAIARRSAQLGDGDFSVRVGHFGIPEVDAVATALDSSASRIAELVAREREFSTTVSHQLRTPLTALRLRLEQAQRRGDDGAMAAVLAEADRLEATVEDLLTHARQTSAAERVGVNLGTVVHDHVGTWRPLLTRAGRKLDVTVPKNTLAHVGRGTVGQILDVLLDNALRHGAGAVTVGVSVDARTAVVTVSDEGPGVPAADRDRVFARGATSGGGTGIGLHLARALAEADGGTLEISAGHPSRFELRLPLSGEQTPRPA